MNRAKHLMQVSGVLSILCGIGALLAPHASKALAILGALNLAFVIVFGISLGWWLCARAGKWN